MGAIIPILLAVIQRFPDALAALQQVRSTLSTRDQATLDAQLAAVREQRHAADDELDRVLRERGLG